MNATQNRCRTGMKGDGRTKLHLQNLWRWSCGLEEYPYPEDVVGTLPSPREIGESQWCNEFEQLMRNRIIMGTFRYGALRGGGGTYDNIQSAIDRLVLYQDSGNKEHLVDAANLCLVEWVEEVHPDAHWCATDDGIHKEKM